MFFIQEQHLVSALRESSLEELGVKKFALLGTDYVYPRTTNKILKQYLMDKGIPESDIFVNYTPFGHSDWSKIVSDVVSSRC